MTKGNFFRYYNKLTGADRTLVFFEYKGNIYVHECHHIAPRWTHEEHESTQNGGYQKFKMYLHEGVKEKLVNKSIMVMTVDEFMTIPYKNKGHKCECWLHQVCNLGEYKPDHLRFDKCGDVEINGISYQVKFENASLTNVHTLARAQKDAREMRKMARAK